MFFDCIENKKIYYEEKIFNLGDNIWYLPDFHFVCDENLWDSADFFIEIKPMGGATKLAIKKCKRLASFSKTLVMLIQGFPNEHKVTFFEYNEDKVVKKKADNFWNKFENLKEHAERASSYHFTSRFDKIR